MIKSIAWNLFKNTGSIDTFLEFKQIQNIENDNEVNNIIKRDSNIKPEGNMLNDSTIIPTGQRVELNGNDKNKWNNNF